MSQHNQIIDYHKKTQTVTLAITGASGIDYGMRLLECLVRSGHRVYLLISPAAYAVSVLEADLKLPGQTDALEKMLTNAFQASPGQIRAFAPHEWTAPIASGSAMVDAMVVCPCSDGSLAAIAHGMSDNLIERAADVMIKEQKKLILVPRETPLSVIHLENMLKLAKLGVTILPAMPGFYHKPTSIHDLVDFVVARILNQLGIPHELLPPWGERILNQE